MRVSVDRTGPQSSLARYVRARMRREETEHGGAYQAEMVRRSGLKSSTIANIVNAKQGVGPEAGTKLARAWGATYAQLVTEADEWAKQAPAATPPMGMVLRPNLERAIEASGVAEDVAEEARDLSRHTRMDYRVVVWMMLLEEIAASRAAGPSARKGPRSAP